MNPTLKKALYIILLSLGLALVFNYLFFDKLIGISVFIFVVVLLVTVFAFALDQKVPTKKTWWLVALIAFFALMPGIRASGFLTFLNVVATFGLLMLLAHQLVGTPVFLMKLRDYATLAIVVPFSMLARAISTIILLGQIHSDVKNRDTWIRVIKGVVMAVPILILFGILFSQADLAFSRFLNSIIDINLSERTVGYIVLLVFAFVAGLSFLSYIFFPKESGRVTPAPEPGSSSVQPGKGIEVLVFLGLICALFLLFIGFQVTYLFGGEANIVNAGFTYAEYARRGFFELLAVSVLSLLVLLASEQYARAEENKDKRFLIPSLVLIAEVIVVMISAFKRLSLYIDAYSLTELRFYVAAFIMLLLVLFILLAIKFLKSKPENFFTFGTLLSVLVFLMVMNFVNPDSFIAKSNLDQYNRTGKVDALYVAHLSADATAEKMELYNKYQGQDKQDFRALLQIQKDNLQHHTTHWQSTNLSRTRALRLLSKLGE